MPAIKPRDRTGVEPGALAAQNPRLMGGPGHHWLTPVAEMAALAGGKWSLCPDAAAIRWACFPGAAGRAPGVTADGLHAAREFTLTTLQRWGVTARGEDIVIVVSELLTNALRHALPSSGGTRSGWPVRLGLLQPGQCVVCAVADPSRTVPVPRKPGYLGETGRGLHVIAALSDQWGCTTPGDTGKILWAMFRHGRPGPG